MSGRAWYKRYPADFLHGTSMLSCEEKGAYSVALDLMYERGGPIPDDAVWIARLCGCSVRKWSQTLRPALIRLGKLRVTEDGRLSNGRMEYETHRSEERLAVAREAGRRGGVMKARHATGRETIIAPINQDNVWNFNTLDSHTPVVDTAPTITPAIIEAIIPAPSNDISDVAWDTQVEIAPETETRATGATELSTIYRLDNSAIIQTNINEINTPRLADSETQKESKKESKKEYTPAGCCVPACASPPPPAQRRDRGTRLAEDWQLTEADIAFALTLLTPHQMQQAADRFLDYWIAKPGAAGRKVSWAATWRNWVRRDAEDISKRAPVAKKSVYEMVREHVGHSVLFPLDGQDDTADIGAERVPALAWGDAR